MSAGLSRFSARQHRVAEHAHRLRLGRHVVDRHAVDDVQRLVGRAAHADGAATADEHLPAGARLPVVLADVHPGRSALDHLVDVGLHAAVRGGGIDCGDRSRDGLTTLRPVSRHHDRLENRRSRNQREVHRGRATRRDGDLLELGPVPDAGRAHSLRAGSDARDPEGAVVPAEVTKRGTGNGHFNVGQGLLGRLVDDLPSDAAGGILRAEGDRQEQTSDQRGSEVTDKCHTSMPSTDGSEVPPSLDFSPYPSPEPGLVKDPPPAGCATAETMLS